MTKQDLEIAKQLKRRLSEVAEVLDLRVFGSRARGDEDECSDMDVFIEVAFLDRELKTDISEIVWEVGFEHFIVISPLVFTREEIKKSPLRSSPIFRTIVKEGISV